MARPPAALLRWLAAALVCLTGLARIAGLWQRELSGVVVIDAVLGGVYLLLALGLLGISRFSLFMGVVVPGAVAMLSWRLSPETAPLREQYLVVNIAIATLCAIALWRVRKLPSA